jgi:microcystin-dependent protein
MANFVGEVILVGFNFAPSGFAFCDGQLLSIEDNDALYQVIGTTYGGDGETTFALPDLRGRVPIHQGQGTGSVYTIGEMDGVEAVTLITPQLPGHTHAINIGTMTATAKCRNSAANSHSPAGRLPAVASNAAPFTDDTLSIGSTPARAVHITELRARVDAVRSQLRLGTFTYADGTINRSTTTILAQHILELRTSLAQAYAAAKLTPPVYTDPDLGVGIPIKAAHIAELRSAVVATGITTSTPYANAAADADMQSGAIAIGGTAAATATGGSQPHNNMQPSLTLGYCIALTGTFPTQ